jgi:hypothetical protein
LIHNNELLLYRWLYRKALISRSRCDHLITERGGKS